MKKYAEPVLAGQEPLIDCAELLETDFCFACRKPSAERRLGRCRPCVAELEAVCKQRIAEQSAEFQKLRDSGMSVVHASAHMDRKGASDSRRAQL